MRGDYKSRMEGYAIGRQNGWLSANDIRSLEDLNPQRRRCAQAAGAYCYGADFPHPAAADIKADELVTLVYSLKRPYRKNAAFLVNDQTLASIRKLKDNNGAYLWQPSYQMGEPDRLLGYPVHTSAYMPVAAAGKIALAFGDYAYYNIGDRGTRSLQELKELFAGNGMVAYLMKERVDGKLVLAEAVQLLKIKG